MARKGLFDRYLKNRLLNGSCPETSSERDNQHANVYLYTFGLLSIWLRPAQGKMTTQVHDQGIDPKWATQGKACVLCNIFTCRKAQDAYVLV